MQTDTLYFDGACPLCRAEMGKLARFSRGGLDLIDIHQLPPGQVEIDNAMLLARLHLKTGDGEWITGLKANIRAWQYTRLGFIWRVLDWPLINRISYPAYEFWLRRRNAKQCGVQRPPA